MTGDIFESNKTVTIRLGEIDNSLAALVKEADEEIRMRIRVYARRIENGYMTRQLSKAKIGRMHDIRNILSRLQKAAEE